MNPTTSCERWQGPHAVSVDGDWAMAVVKYGNRRQVNWSKMSMVTSGEVEEKEQKMKERKLSRR